MMRVLGAWMGLAMAASGTAMAVEVKVISGGAGKSAFTEAAAAWERETGHKVVAVFAPAGELRRKLAAGEIADVVILPRENVADAAAALDPGARYDIAAVSMAAAVRAGAPKPDISTPEAL